MRKLKHTLCIMLTLILMVTSIMVIPVSAEADGDTIITVPITVQEEYSMANHYDYIVCNGEVEQAVEELRSIIKAARCTVDRRINLLR